MSLSIIALLQAITALLANPQVQANPVILATANTLANSVNVVVEEATALDASSIASQIPTDESGTTQTVAAAPAPINQPTQNMETTQEVTKAISVDVNSDNPTISKIYAYYTEDGQNVAGVALTMTADDAGTIRSSDSPDKFKIADNEQYTHPNVGEQSQIGAVFTYEPTDSASHVLTISGNGVEQTVTVPGKQ